MIIHGDIEDLIEEINLKALETIPNRESELPVRVCGCGREFIPDGENHIICDFSCKGKT